MTHNIALDAFKKVPANGIQALRDAVASTAAGICHGMDFEETVKPQQDQPIAQNIFSAGAII